MVRVAGAEGDGEPRILAELPSDSPARPLDPDAVGDLLADLFATRPAELLLVHAAGRAPPVEGWAGLACVVRAVPSCVAAVAGHHDVGKALVVLDVGHSGAEATLLSPGGRPVRTQNCPVGGSRLDDVVLDILLARGAGGAGCGAVAAGDVAGRAALRAEARRLREALSLLPVMTARLPGTGVQVRLTAAEVRAGLEGPLGETVDAVRAVLADRSLTDLAGTWAAGRVSVLLVGGVARTPLLGELFDAAGVGDVAVASCPDVAPVLGALRLGALRLVSRPLVSPAVSWPGLTAPPHRAPPPQAPSHRAPSHQAPPHPQPLPGPTDVHGPTNAAVPVAPSHWLPPLPPRRPRRLRTASVTAGGVATVSALIGVGMVSAPASSAPSVPAGVVAQYGYAMQLPPGWAHSGGLPERRRTLLTPEATPEGSDLVSVERTPLGYDAGAEPERAGAELRAEFDAAVAAGAPLSGFDSGGWYAGRPVAAYRQRASDGRTVVDWYVLLDGDAQLSVGCQYTASGAVEVGRACEVVVRSVHRS